MRKCAKIDETVAIKTFSLSPMHVILRKHILTSSIETLRAKAAALRSKRGVVTEKLFELERNLTETFSEMKIYAQSCKVNLDQIDEDEWTYGYLSFHDGVINVAYRSTEDDFADAMQNTPEEFQSYRQKHISVCSVEWLEKFAVDRIIESLVRNLDKQLDEMNNTADQSVLSMNKILEAQAEQLNTDTIDILANFADSSLISMWNKARRSITTDPAESITRSSSYIESVCRKILADLNQPLPTTITMTSLINECVKFVKLSHDKKAQSDLLQLTSNLKGVCQAIGTLRTHFGSAHGSSLGDYEVDEHDARFANNAAATVSSFLLHRHRENIDTNQRVVSPNPPLNNY